MAGLIAIISFKAFTAFGESINLLLSISEMVKERVVH
jgi:hypothetical protein